MLILNDTHIGVRRVGGTTPASAHALREYIRGDFQVALNAYTGTVLHAGDLFDTFEVSNYEFEETHRILHDWLESDKDNKLIAMRGNHDFHESAGKVSSWNLLMTILEMHFGNRVVPVTEGLTEIEREVYTIPHMANQDLFDLELEKALKNGSGKLFLHANCANPFADQSDHSLNVTLEYCQRFQEEGIQLIFAHEHQARCIDMKNGKLRHLSSFDPEADIIVMGNQTPTSIADCLAHGSAQKDGSKYAHVLDDRGMRQARLWSAASDFIQVDWTELDQVQGERFIRVVGDVGQAQSAEVIELIAKFRSKSNAFIISNAVKVEGIQTMENMDGASLEEIKAFNVREELFKIMTSEEIEVLTKVLE